MRVDVNGRSPLRRTGVGNGCYHLRHGRNGLQALHALRLAASAPAGSAAGTPISLLTQLAPPRGPSYLGARVRAQYLGIWCFANRVNQPAFEPAHWSELLGAVLIVL